MPVLANANSLHVAVLSGGASSEREVSLVSGRAVAAALRAAGHRVARFDPAGTELATIDWPTFDAAFIALHGGAGEDGRVQTVLDTLGVPYTGSGPDASRVAMSKLAAKACLARHGVPTPKSIALNSADRVGDLAQRFRALGFPLVVKPDSQGCSLGVSVARGWDDLPKCIAAAGTYESTLLAEPLIAGREFTVAIVGCEPLPVLEIVHGRPLFDYDAKFHSDYEVVRPAAKFDPAARCAARTAIEAAAAVGTRGLVRVDLIVDDAGKPWVLELNTVPGMTEQSLAPRAAALAGLDMPQFCHRLVHECLATVEAH